MNYHMEFFEDTQSNPSEECPLEYLKVTKGGNKLTLITKGRTSETEEEPRVFEGPNRYRDYDAFLKFMGKNLENFNMCVNPLKDDPEYKKAITEPEATSSPPSTTTDTTPTASSDNLDDYINQLLKTPSRTAPTSSDFSLPNLSTPSVSFSTPSFRDMKLDTPILHATKGWDFNFSWSGGFFYLFKLAILFGLIFLFTSVIPKQEMELNTRLIISVVVVLAYILLDIFRNIAIRIKKEICSATCGC